MNRREIADAAWAEWVVAKGYSSHNNALDTLLSGVRPRHGPRPWWAMRFAPPGWFMKDEIGYAYNEHSLEATCRMLRVNNMRHMKMLGPDAPWRVSWPKI